MFLFDVLCMVSATVYSVGREKVEWWWICRSRKMILANTLFPDFNNQTDKLTNHTLHCGININHNDEQ